MNVFTEFDPAELNENESKLSTLLQQTALALSVKAAGRLIVVDPDQGRRYWVTSSGLRTMVEIWNSTMEVQYLRSLPQGTDGVVIHGHVGALMDSFTKLAAQALTELERLGHHDAALLFTRAGEPRIYELRALCEMEEQHLEALRDEIRVREKQLARLKNLGGEDRPNCDSEGSGANGEMLP